MRFKFLWFILSFIMINMVSYHTVYASTNINKLSPNDYQEDSFKKNTDLLHDQSSSNEKLKIPQEQKGLTFEGKSTNTFSELSYRLFKNEARDTNTIKAKAESLDLFTEEQSTRLDGMEENGQDSSSLSVLMGVLAGICVVLLLSVLIIWSKASQRKENLT
ncbi:hypothetical protein Q75_00585 [Bacillus coahuilensis p1.1.43]|uniref:Type VII secretion protein EssA n=1 Tax=Bacillus coahuilensis p1.1.43 TaxID=1150625 RepID=A0A147KCT2_9BACI|nr:type VII secretion protein EssA [Bacillus coahuilensis]KUP09452.1 hypothetical protein Q75_00585 [Bacillus coahuilensis p1.1.43]